MTEKEKRQKKDAETKRIKEACDGMTFNGNPVEVVNTRGGYYYFKQDGILLSRVARDELVQTVDDCIEGGYTLDYALSGHDDWANKVVVAMSEKKDIEIVEPPVAVTGAGVLVDDSVQASTDSAVTLIDGLADAVAKKIKARPDRDWVEMVVKETLERAVKTIEIIIPDMPKITLAAEHKTMPDILKHIAMRENLMLVGPTGSGKTTACSHAAKACGLNYYPYSVGLMTTDSKLLGFVDANSNYLKTIIREAYEFGGLLLLDEMDAGHAGVLTIMNALLENGYCSFPDGVIKKHKDFVCICACNTFGRGADRQYVGRNQLDAATLDRFSVMNFDYDETLEDMLVNNKNWLHKVQSYRHAADRLKMRVIISPRASIKGEQFLKAGFSETQVEDMLIWKGIAKDQIAKIKEAA